jgi:hypothetical protein
MFNKLKVKRTAKKIEKTAISSAEFNASAIKAKKGFLQKSKSAKINDEFIMKIVEQQLENFNKLTKNGRRINQEFSEIKTAQNNSLKEIKEIRDGLTVLMRNYQHILEKQHHDLIHNEYTEFSVNFNQEIKISGESEKLFKLLKIKVDGLQALASKNKISLGHAKSALYGSESLILSSSMSGQAGFVDERALKDIIQCGFGLFCIILLWKIIWPFYLMLGIAGLIGLGFHYYGNKN